MNTKRVKILSACLVLLVVIISIYANATHFDFISYDDNHYVYENNHIQNGLTWKGIKWAFTNVERGQYIPMVWLSYMCDIQLAGLSPGWLHLTNLFLHLANTFILFILLNQMTGRFWESFFVSLIFAVHPIHVESVAWITERKDVLSGFFCFSTIFSYSAYIRYRRKGYYAFAIFLFLLGIFSKPMIVTLPLLLFLLDYWPLRRFRLPCKGNRLPSLTTITLEKIPFIAVSLLVCYITYSATLNAGGILTGPSLFHKFSNAIISYSHYLIKFMWPLNLSIFYPYPAYIPFWKVAASFSFLMVVSAFCFKLMKSNPYLITGWLWYLVCLLPVIGFVQAGSQSMADRFVYIPFIGIYIIWVWGISNISTTFPLNKKYITISFLPIFIFFIIIANRQVQYWKNSRILFDHAVKKTRGNYLAYTHLGDAFFRSHLLEEAKTHYLTAIQINPYYSEAYYRLGLVHKDQGLLKEAVFYFNKALLLNPENAEVHNFLALALVMQGRRKEAFVHFNKSLSIFPDSEAVHNNIGYFYYEEGDFSKASYHFKEALKIKPDYKPAINNLSRISSIH